MNKDLSGKKVLGFDARGQAVCSDRHEYPRPGYRKAKARMGRSFAQTQPMEVATIEAANDILEAGPQPLAENSRQADKSLANQEVPNDACIDISPGNGAGRLVSSNKTIDGQVVEVDDVVEDENGMAIALVRVGEGQAKIPVCKPLEPTDRIYTFPCCIEEETRVLVCAENADRDIMMFDGKLVPGEACRFVDRNGKRVCRIVCENLSDDMELFVELCESYDTIEIPVCKREDAPTIQTGVKMDSVQTGIKTTPADPEPVVCCLDPDTSSLLCEGHELHGIKVSFDEEDVCEMPSGSPAVLVRHASLPEGVACIRFCKPPTKKQPPKTELPPPPLVIADDPPPPLVEVFEPIGPEKPLPTPVNAPEGCCYSGLAGALVCPGSPFHGLKVQLLQVGSVENGHPVFVVGHAKFKDGYAIVPGCPSESQDEDSSGCGGRVFAGICLDHKNCDGEGRQFAGPGYNIGSRDFQMFPGMRGAGQGGHPRRFSGFSGRPSEIPRNRRRGTRTGFAEWQSHGPETSKLQQGGVSYPIWGQLGIEPPPNTTEDPKGFNTELFTSPQDVARALEQLGYVGQNKKRMTKLFQAHYNRVSMGCNDRRDMQGIDWVRVPRGLLVVDGVMGMRTLNALEVALENQEAGILWGSVVKQLENPDRAPREKIYSAKERWSR